MIENKNLKNDIDLSLLTLLFKSSNIVIIEILDRLSLIDISNIDKTCIFDFYYKLSTLLYSDTDFKSILTFNQILLSNLVENPKIEFFEKILSDIVCSLLNEFGINKNKNYLSDLYLSRLEKLILKEEFKKGSVFYNFLMNSYSLYKYIDYNTYTNIEESLKSYINSNLEDENIVIITKENLKIQSSETCQNRNQDEDKYYILLINKALQSLSLFKYDNLEEELLECIKITQSVGDISNLIISYIAIHKYYKAVGNKCLSDEYIQSSIKKSKYINTRFLYFQSMVEYSNYCLIYSSHIGEPISNSYSASSFLFITFSDAFQTKQAYISLLEEENQIEQKRRIKFDFFIFKINNLLIRRQRSMSIRYLIHLLHFYELSKEELDKVVQLILILLIYDIDSIFLVLKSMNEKNLLLINENPYHYTLFYIFLMIKLKNDYQESFTSKVNECISIYNKENEENVCKIISNEVFVSIILLNFNRLEEYYESENVNIFNLICILVIKSMFVNYHSEKYTSEEKEFILNDVLNKAKLYNYPFLVEVIKQKKGYERKLLGSKSLVRSDEEICFFECVFYYLVNEMEKENENEKLSLDEVIRLVSMMNI